MIKLCKFVHYDTDDLLTNLYEGHRLYATYKEQKLSEITKWYYHNADIVTVTQRKFAERIAPYCQNTLAVIRNAIDYDLQNWNHPKVPAHKKNYALQDPRLENFIKEQGAGVCN